MIVNVSKRIREERKEQEKKKETKNTQKENEKKKLGVAKIGRATPAGKKDRQVEKDMGRVLAIVVS